MLGEAVRDLLAVRLEQRPVAAAVGTDDAERAVADVRDVLAGRVGPRVDHTFRGGQLAAAVPVHEVRGPQRAAQRERREPDVGVGRVPDHAASRLPRALPAGAFLRRQVGVRVRVGGEEQAFGAGGDFVRPQAGARVRAAVGSEEHDAVAVGGDREGFGMAEGEAAGLGDLFDQLVGGHEGGVSQLAPTYHPHVELLEREPLLAELRALHELGGRMAFVAGEAGVGKSSLVRAFRAGLLDGTPVHLGFCDALGTPRALGPLYDIAWTSLPPLGEILASGADRYRVFTGFLDLIAATPAVVVVEDVHWADEATLDLLLFVGRRIADLPATVIVTYREEDAGRDHPLRKVLGDLATAGHQRLTVPRLSPEAVSELAARAGRDGSELYAVTGGNAFFVTEALTAPSGQLPETVRDAVLARAGRLSASAQAVLDATSLVPDRAELPLVREVAAADSTALDECVDAGMLVLEGATVRFRHELARRAIESTVPAGHAAQLHDRVLAYLAGIDVADPARLAYHAEAAGDAATVLLHAPSAAEKATALGAHREAAAQYARALRYADQSPIAVRADLWDRRADACVHAGALAEALDASATAIDLWRSVGEISRQAVCLARRSHLLSRTAQYEAAHSTARAAIALLEALPPSAPLALAYAAQARLLMLARDIPAAIEVGKKAVELAERCDDQVTLAKALNTVGACHWFVDPDVAVELLLSALEVARRAGDDLEFSLVLSNLGTGAGEVRRYDVAYQWLDEAIAWTKARDLDTFRGYSLAWKSRVLYEQGRWSEATSLATEVMRGPWEDVPTHIVALTVLGGLRVRRGDPDAEGPLLSARSLAQRAGDLQRTWPVAAALAESAWLSGVPERIPELVLEPFQLAVERRHAWAVGELGWWLSVAGSPAEVGPVVAGPFALQLAGSAAEAAAAWRELGCPYEAALASAASADLQLSALSELRALGARPAAELVARRLRDRGVRNVPRGPQRATRTHAGMLTGREAEVLALVVDGLRNAEIAARLHLSPRTVDRHVSAILAKLEVGSRREAARWARANLSTGPA